MVRGVRKGRESKKVAGFVSCGRYTVAKKIGSGGFGEVFVGAPAGNVNEKMSSSKVAIKRYKAIPTRTKDASPESTPGGITATAVREIANLRSIGEHPNVVALRDVGFAGERPFAVFDLYPQDLMEAAKTMDPKRRRALAPQVTLQLCRALAHLDSLGIVHRDVKLENVLCRWAGRERIHIALCDLGSSRYIGEATKLENETICASTELDKEWQDRKLARRISEDASLTVLSPEMREQCVCDHLSDVFLMANCVFEFVSMRTMVEEDLDRPEFLARVCGVPPLAKCFSRDPKCRPRASEVLRLLGQTRVHSTRSCDDEKERVAAKSSQDTNDSLPTEHPTTKKQASNPLECLSLEMTCLTLSKILQRERTIDPALIDCIAGLEEAVREVVSLASAHDRNRAREPELTVSAAFSLVCKFDGRLPISIRIRATAELLGVERMSSTTWNKISSMEWAIFASIDFNLRPLLKAMR